VGSGPKKGFPMIWKSKANKLAAITSVCRLSRLFYVNYADEQMFELGQLSASSCDFVVKIKNPNCSAIVWCFRLALAATKTQKRIPRSARRCRSDKFVSKCERGKSKRKVFIMKIFLDSTPFCGFFRDSSNWSFPPRRRPQIVESRASHANLSIGRFPATMFSPPPSALPPS
jgi:hypothetical protein